LRLATAAADTNALRVILGPGSEDLQNPDRIQATNELKTFSSALAETNHLVHVSDRLVVLELGDDLWPFPVPLVKTKWALLAAGLRWRPEPARAARRLRASRRLQPGAARGGRSPTRAIPWVPFQDSHPPG